MGNKAYVGLAAVCIMLAAGCSSAPSKPQAAAIKAPASYWTVDMDPNCRFRNGDPCGYGEATWAVLAKAGGSQWGVKQFYRLDKQTSYSKPKFEVLDQAGNLVGTADRTPQMEPGQLEIVFFSIPNRRVMPFLDDEQAEMPPVGKTVLCPLIEGRREGKLSPCQSSFFRTNVGATTTGNIGGTILTLGLGAAFAGPQKELDREQVTALMDSTIFPAWEKAALNRAATIPEVERYLNDFRRVPAGTMVSAAEAKLVSLKAANYRGDFAAATTVQKLDAFIVTYRNADPDGLVPIATAKMNEQMRAEDAQRRQAAKEWDQQMAAFLAERNQRVSKRGTRVCRKDSVPNRLEFGGVTQLTYIAYVEDFTQDKLRLTVANVDGLCRQGICYNVTPVYMDTPMRQGTVLWDATANWDSC